MSFYLLNGALSTINPPIGWIFTFMPVNRKVLSVAHSGTMPTGNLRLARLDISLSTQIEFLVPIGSSFGICVDLV